MFGNKDDPVFLCTMNDAEAIRQSLCLRKEAGHLRKKYFLYNSFYDVLHLLLMTYEFMSYNCFSQKYIRHLIFKSLAKKK